MPFFLWLFTPKRASCSRRREGDAVLKLEYKCKSPSPASPATPSASVPSPSPPRPWCAASRSAAGLAWAWRGSTRRRFARLCPLQPCVRPSRVSRGWGGLCLLPLAVGVLGCRCWGFYICKVAGHVTWHVTFTFVMLHLHLACYIACYTACYKIDSPFVTFRRGARAVM